MTIEASLAALTAAVCYQTAVLHLIDRRLSTVLPAPPRRSPRARLRILVIAALLGAALMFLTLGGTKLLTG